jgi:hypothetical protein
MTISKLFRGKITFSSFQFLYLLFIFPFRCGSMVIHRPLKFSKTHFGALPVGDRLEISIPGAAHQGAPQAKQHKGLARLAF